MSDLNEKIIKEATKRKVKTFDQFLKLKRSLIKNTKKSLPSNIALFKTYKKLLREKNIRPNSDLEKLLQTNKIRSLSGVAIITCITADYPCPGKCLYCPKEENIPQSYLSNEPAIMRAILAHFDPKRQVEIRLKALKLQNHPIDKIELIILGGTFSALPQKYRREFIKSCYDALNANNARSIAKSTKSLEESKKLNEKAKSRCVGLTIETRPDFINQNEIKYLRQLGVTRIELGVQNIFDDVLKKNKRGHKANDVVKATKLLKDAGFKVGYHIMPGLYGSNLNRDFEVFKTIFNDERFKPDYLKIYPCVVIRGSGLYKLWQNGKYKPYSDRELLDLLIRIKKIVPYYVRIHRLIRDIPSASIIAGNKITNLRQVLKERKVKCRCIRCREIQDKIVKDKPILFRDDYEASKGKEIFLSFETKDRKHLFALLRLRISKDYFLPVLKNSAIIRELHTYGSQVPIGQKISSAFQHKNLGRKLIDKAEKIAKKEFTSPKIAVISAVGTREYYKKLGYFLKDEYMIKKL